MYVMINPFVFCLTLKPTATPILIVYYFCIIAMLTAPAFWKLLKNRAAPCSTHINDITDGLEYCKLTQPGGFLCKETNPANISFTLNTDGVSLFKSSHTDIWPIFLTINELPPAVR